eukprot:11525645-Ditylum_brightwellii.AAC.1
MLSRSLTVAYSVSGDGTKTAEAVGESSHYCAIVGGTYPNHFISIPSPHEDYPGDEDEFVKEFILQTLECFNRDKAAMKKAAETNLATLTYQAMKEKCANLHFCRFLEGHKQK